MELLPADQQNTLLAVHSLICTCMGGFFNFCGLKTPLCLQIELTPITLSFQHRRREFSSPLDCCTCGCLSGMSLEVLNMLHGAAC